MLILSAADCERLILARHDDQPLSAEDRRALDHPTLRTGHDRPHDLPAPSPPRRRWAFVKETAQRG